MEVLAKTEDRFIGITILNGLREYHKIAIDLLVHHDVDYEVLRALTYRPELIRMSLCFIQFNTADILTRERKQAHPLLHELMHQSSILYREPLLTNPDYDKARENLVFFLERLYGIEPEFWKLRDKKGHLPYQRLRNINGAHPATQEVLNRITWVSLEPELTD